jgi:parallel beta-helix repeat protein
MQTNSKNLYLVQRILKRKTQAQLAFAKGQIKKADKYLQKANTAFRFLLKRTNSSTQSKFYKILASLALTGALTLTSAQAATITVTTLADENNGNTASIALLQGTPGGAGISLREAVIAANNTAGDDIIQLVAGSTYPLNVFTTTGEDAAAQGDLDILNNGSITIQLVSAGANAVIDGNATDQVLHILTGASLTLNNITVQNGRSLTSGAGLLNAGTCTLNNSTVTGNIIPAIAVSAYGAGIFNDGTSGAVCTINNSILSDNDNFDSFGGAMVNFNGGTINLNNSTVSGNHGLNSGGAICNFNSIFNVNNSTFSGNETGAGAGFGGAIDNYGAASVTTIKNSTISGNTASGSGGGIYTNINSTMTMTNCTVTNNTATGGSGGGIFINGGTTVNLGNSIVSANIGTNPNISGTVASQGNNMINNVTGTAGTVGSDITGGGVTVNLGALANNGGNTQTHAVLAGSSAIDGGSNALATAASLTTDQRGGAFNRTISGTVDIGSFEFGNVVACVVVTAPAEVTNTWIGCNSSDWSDAANWSTNAVPLVTDIVYVPTTAVNELIIDETATCAKMLVQIGAKCKVDYNAGGKLLIKF